MEEQNLQERLEKRGISRRDFLKFCGLMTAALALPVSMTNQVATAVAAAARLPVVWLSFQECTGDTESFLRSGYPSVTKILLELISLNYHETLMVPSGALAEKSLWDTVTNSRGAYVAVIEGAIPTAANGAYCTVGGRTALSIAQQVCGSARAVISVGACATDGGWPGAAPNPTGAKGVMQALPNLTNVVNLPGCPMNVINFSALLTYMLANNRLPELDNYRRPMFAYGEEIHEECPRKDHYEEERFVLAWGDEGHKKGWCLYKMGCKGPRTKANCPEKKWNGGTSWPIGAGHGCIGCAAPRFWDTLTPVYVPLPDDGDDDDDAANGAN